MDKQAGRYLLILPCSKRKKEVLSAPAIELYDGQFYRVLRRNMPRDLDVLILSAKYGLIDSNENIQNYDQTMSAARAEQLSNSVRAKLQETLEENHYDSVFVNLGKTYMRALKKSKEALAGHSICWGEGQIGQRSHQLRSWLKAISTKSKGKL